MGGTFPGAVYTCNFATWLERLYRSGFSLHMQCSAISALVPDNRPSATQESVQLTVVVACICQTVIEHGSHYVFDCGCRVGATGNLP